MSAFNWVAARAECSPDRAFHALAEVVDSDVKAANGLRRSGVSFHFHGEATGKIVVIRELDRGGVKELRSVVFELISGEIVTKKGPENSVLFSAVPSLNRNGECLLEIEGDSYELWQVSRRALESLFFGF